MSAVQVRRAVVAGGLAGPWFFGWLFAIGALRTDYSQATNAVGELGAFGAPYMGFWNLFGFVGTGVLLIAFATGYRAVLGERATGSGALTAAGALFCLTAVPIAMGADGHPELTSTWTRVHMTGALLAPWAWLFALSRLASEHRGGELRWLSVASVIAVAVFLLAMGASMGELIPAAPGVLQRITFLPFLVWYSAAAWILLGYHGRAARDLSTADAGSVAPTASGRRGRRRKRRGRAARK